MATPITGDPWADFGWTRLGSSRGPNYAEMPGDPWRDLDWHALDSACLKGCAWDEATGRLFLHFTGGRVYAFERVTGYEYGALLAAGSPGRHFARSIKNRYSNRQVA